MRNKGLSLGVFAALLMGLFGFVGATAQEKEVFTAPPAPQWGYPPVSTYAFYLDDQAEIEILNYKSKRDVRLCADERRHDVGITVHFDGNKAKVRPGDCFQFEAKRVTVSPAGSLGDSWDLSGIIQSIRS